MNGRRDGLGRWYLGLTACNPQLHSSWKQNPCLFVNEIKEGCLVPALQLKPALGCSSKLSMKTAFAFHGPDGGGGAGAQQKGKVAIGERPPRPNIALLLCL